LIQIKQGDCREVLKTLPDESVHCVVTSPPYFGLRDYGVDGQIGLEDQPDAFVDQLVKVFSEVRRVLRDDGTLWLNLGDSYAANRTYQVHNTKGASEHTYSKGSKVPAGLKPKDLVGIPWRVAFALQLDGWWLRQEIIWSKPNPMPESVTDRCTKAHEHIFLLAKSERYYFDAASIAEASVTPEDTKAGCNFGGAKCADTEMSKSNQPGKAWVHSETRNKRSVWTVTTKPFADAHFATFPTDLIEPCILAGCPEGGTVLDPFGGAGTTGLVADRNKRNAILIELNPEYAEMARKRIYNDAPLFAEVT
jgi:DNA modification methylase